MKTTTASKILPITALGLTLGIFAGFASAGDKSEYDAENGNDMDGRSSQQQGGNMSRDQDLESTTRSGAGMSGQDDNGPAGTDATRSVPGAPDVGTNPATKPGSQNN